MAIESSENPVLTGEERSSKGPSFRSLAIAGLILLVIGIVGGGWAMNRWLETGGNVTQTRVIDTVTPGGTLAVAGAGEAPAPVGTTPPPLAVIAPEGADALAARVAELEQRLSRITLEAASASGNASRAEGLLVAFAVRRALDRGLSLGYLEAQLRLRRELGELFVVRAAGTQSPRATERLDRARRYLAAGMADKAIEEVQAMPGAAAANDWLIDARRYNEARRALDLIETAAILEPRDSAAAAMAGKAPAATTP